MKGGGGRVVVLSELCAKGERVEEGWGEIYFEEISGAGGVLFGEVGTHKFRSFWEVEGKGW